MITAAAKGDLVALQSTLTEHDAEVRPDALNRLGMALVVAATWNHQHVANHIVDHYPAHFASLPFEHKRGLMMQLARRGLIDTILLLRERFASFRRPRLARHLVKCALLEGARECAERLIAVQGHFDGDEHEAAWFGFEIHFWGGVWVLELLKRHAYRFHARMLDAARTERARVSGKTYECGIMDECIAFLETELGQPK